MTKENARKQLIGILDRFKLQLYGDDVNAMKVAIQTLKQEEPTSPCDLCIFNPSSSCDGKPCTMCPALKGGE